MFENTAGSVYAPPSPLVLFFLPLLLGLVVHLTGPGTVTCGITTSEPSLKAFAD